MTNQIGDITNVLTYAHEACRKYELNEIDSEVLLFAITDDMNCMAYEAMQNAGYNVNKLKKLLRERFAQNKPAKYTACSPFSTSVEGLIALHTLQYGGKPLTSIGLLKIIIQNENTSAARLLRSERLKLNWKNELIYKPLNF
jgi:ATP-dependent Clp protease ATP-binding subunit ClpA